MAFKVLVVDDSSFFRRRVTEILNEDRELEVIDVAVNGQEAVEKALALKPDVITMDVEMPVLDGITAVRQIMQKSPIPILMFSSLTHEGAKATFDALDAGAIDFLPKKFEDIARNKNEASETLQQRVKTVARSRSVRRTSRLSSSTNSLTSQSTRTAPGRSPLEGRSRFSRPSSSTTAASGSSLNRSLDSSARTTRSDALRNESTRNEAVKPSSTRASGGRGRYKLTAIGTSTGGPVALQTILTELPKDYPHPILLIQHMPATFTAAFASRLNSLCKIDVKEAQDGDQLKPGVAYLAPGGTQMVVEGRAEAPRLKIMEDDSPRITYKPSVDITFGTTAKVLKDKVLAIVLTGMGADGREGARLLKQYGSTIWAQDEESSVVYGMPQAVYSAGLADEEYALKDFAEKILREIGHG